MMLTEEMIAKDEKRWNDRNIVAELGYCGKNILHRKNITNDDIRFYAYIMRKAHALLKEQDPKPIAYTDNPYTGLPVARCPKCGKFARQFHASTDEETHYCPWCGQKVKWE